jgi:hypothetical protein
VVSAADPYCRNLSFSRPEPLLFLSSSSPIVHSEVNRSKIKAIINTLWLFPGDKNNGLVSI